MGISMGGLLLKKGQSIGDEKILAILGHADASDGGTTNMDEATSREFEGIGIARVDDAVVVLGRDIPYACSFEKGEKQSALDLDLAALSKERDIVCFLIDGGSGTYAYSIFSGGERVRVNSVSGGETLLDYGGGTEYDGGLSANQTGLTRLVANFTGHTLVELLDDLDLTVEVYHL
ncbi:hypothetical protein ACQ86N_04085 [Puia sp. P3]|uniref:hypothetical protein n=1 Tax=Puia sp. P3 TaxID=3423952 RepID=UPI003D666F2A